MLPVACAHCSWLSDLESAADSRLSCAPEQCGAGGTGNITFESDHSKRNRSALRHSLRRENPQQNVSHGPVMIRKRLRILRPSPTPSSLRARCTAGRTPCSSPSRSSDNEPPSPAAVRFVTWHRHRQPHPTCPDSFTTPSKLRPQLLHRHHVVQIQKRRRQNISRSPASSSQTDSR